MEDHNDWISVGDLMAGAVAVVALMFVVAVLQNRFGRPTLDLEGQKELTIFLKDFAKQVKNNPSINVDIDNFKLYVKGGGFESGSSCLKGSIFLEMRRLNAYLTYFMKTYPSITITMEGHSDTTPIGSQVSDDCRCNKPCKSNVELSLARAFAARDEITYGWAGNLNERVLVYGYGYNHFDKSRSMDENRRVEISFNFSSLKRK